MQKTRKIILILGLLFVPAFCSEKDRIVRLFQTPNWDSISTAIVLVNANINIYKQDGVVQRQVSDLLHDLTMHERNPNVKFIPKEGDSGEIEGDIVFMAMKLETPGIEFLLLDWVQNARAAGRFISTRIIQHGCSNTSIIDSISNRFVSTNEFDIHNRVGYLEVICEVAQDTNFKCGSVKKIAQTMLVTLLNTADENQRLAAIAMSKPFLKESIIQTAVDSLAKTDGYREKRKGKTIYPIREAAKAILEGKQK